MIAGTRRLRALALPLVLAALPSACCAGTEERTLNVYSERTVSVTRGPGGAPLAMTLESRVGMEVGSAAYQATWDAVANGATLPGGQGVAITASTARLPGDTSTVVVGLALVLPTPLREGATFTVGAALPPPSATDMPMYWSVWGARPLPAPERAAVSLRAFNYLPVGMQTLNDFIATGATGTVQVSDRSGAGVQLQLDVTATDGSGRTVRIQGPLRVEEQRFTPPC